ncbi:QcrA and Rieske domain-containing protein [Rhodoplanes sp. Z2-YC6860]|uniref:QcrA and Rieske domain-containing protein n=1 Tax=Rhodoplanes sp. Z2-YC6860 TaxID=674703 RepID=UPI0008367016|nr:Rieske 2Fe-2S domain-containing protein [Rhodoplanes sp. Z2-YC6860]
MTKIGRGGDRVRDEHSTRRDVLAALTAVGAVGVLPGPAAAEPDSERPQAGDLFVSQAGADSESVAPLKPADIPLGGPPVIAWPYDAAGHVVRKGSRLNKVLLLRLDPATLDDATRERAADGIVAYSAICPHAGCEVSVWVADQKIFECSCHYSHYNPRDAAAVLDGPTPRALAALPLKIVDGNLAVAKPFTGRVGIAPA